MIQLATTTATRHISLGIDLGVTSATSRVRAVGNPDKQPAVKVSDCSTTPVNDKAFKAVLGVHKVEFEGQLIEG